MENIQVLFSPKNDTSAVKNATDASKRKIGLAPNLHGKPSTIHLTLGRMKV